MINFNKIVEKIFVGTCPINKTDLECLRQAGITAVLNLSSDNDLKKLNIVWPDLEQIYQKLRISVFRLPITDFDDNDLIEQLQRGVQMLEELVNLNHSVYVHCTAGKQRSPSIVIGYLAWQRKLGLETALQWVLEARSCAPPKNVLEIVDKQRAC